MDAEDAVEAEAYAVLNVPAVIALAKVFQHVPEDTEPPVLIIGDMDSEPIETKGGRDQKVTLILATVMDAEERRPIRALKAKIIELLHGHQATRGGWLMEFTFIGSDGFRDPETATAYVGNFRFTVLALAGA